MRGVALVVVVVEEGRGSVGLANGEECVSVRWAGLLCSQVTGPGGLMAACTLMNLWQELFLLLQPSPTGPGTCVSSSHGTPSLGNRAQQSTSHLACSSLRIGQRPAPPGSKARASPTPHTSTNL